MFKHKLEKRVTKGLNKIFQTYCKKIVSTLEDQDNQKSFLDDIQILLHECNYAVVNFLYPSVLKSAKEGMKQQKKLLGVNFQHLSKNIISYIDNYLNNWRNLHLSSYKGSISHTTIQKIGEIINSGMKDGLSYTQIANQIQKQGEAGVFSPSRAKMIAVREVGATFEAGQNLAIQTARKTGIDYEKYWLTVGDHRVTSPCRHNQTQGRISFDDDFASGDSIPPRRSNPRCRCTCQYRAKDLNNLYQNGYSQEEKDKSPFKIEILRKESEINAKNFGLSYSEAQSIYYYTTPQGCKFIKKNIIRDKKGEKFEELMQNIYSGLAKLPDYNGIVYKGRSELHYLEDQDFFIKNLQDGYKNIYFSSFSQDIEVSKYFMEMSEFGVLTIQDIIGGKNIADISHFPKEKEILMLPNMNFSGIENMKTYKDTYKIVKIKNTIQKKLNNKKNAKKRMDNFMGKQIDKYAEYLENKYGKVDNIEL